MSEICVSVFCSIHTFCSPAKRKCVQDVLSDLQRKVSSEPASRSIMCLQKQICCIHLSLRSVSYLIHPIPTYLPLCIWLKCIFVYIPSTCCVFYCDVPVPHLTANPPGASPWSSICTARFASYSKSSVLPLVFVFSSLLPLVLPLIHSVHHYRSFCQSFRVPIYRNTFTVSGRFPLLEEFCKTPLRHSPHFLFLS